RPPVAAVPVNAIGTNGHGTSTNGSEPVVHDGALDRLATLLEARPIDEVFLGLPLDGSQPLIRPIIALCEEQGITLRAVAHLAALDWGQASIDTLGEQPVITISSGPPDTLRLVAKRMMDVVGATIGLILLLPVLLAVAIAVKLDSNGPIFFVQERVGL